ncbi:CHAP domain-containing protein [Actinophytocola gossypii]|uniref:CHAP domain-containing protein n=1 Tax=Actinophytocola gossypii TaxID=2812003 RepID=A0ABT2JEY3_9PSEU|nr:CHAP domain-containing protein [Actinophytocola gossypii]MCT2586439.1 CHAP domain-containing protein [Actinophytocola gossypii]
MNRYLSKLARATAIGLTAAAMAIVPLTGTATAAPAPAPALAVQADPGDGTIEGAIQWMENHAGATGWEGYCEMAVENAYGTTGVWPSAIAHWNGAVSVGKAHPGDWNAPRGAFVYWNTSQYGHVGISDGNGGFYSTSVAGAIGHRADKGYFVNYLGWSDAQVPQG